MVQRGGTEARCVAAGWSKDLLDAGVSVGAERANPPADSRDRRNESRKADERRDRVDSRIPLCQDRTGKVEEQRFTVARRKPGVAAPTRRYDIEPPVAIEVAGRETVPAAVQPCQARERRRVKASVVVNKDADGAPFDRHQQVRVTVTIDIGKECRRYHTDVAQQLIVDTVGDEPAATVQEQARRG